ncbi:MAG: hypothetical protein ACWGN7_06910, partial [Thermodesulfovibrionales bacterium]
MDKRREFDMGEALDGFISSLPGTISSKLKYDRPSLPVIEKWMLARYPTVESTMAESEKETLDGLSRYIGETIRRLCKGRWAIAIKGRPDRYHDRPVIEDCAGHGNSFCPLTLALEA